MEDRRIIAARAYLERGWKLFTVGPEKRPWHNCAACAPGKCTAQAGACACLWCHGHLAATAELSRVGDMIAGKPESCLAVATGRVSGIVVVDAEGTDRQKIGRTGLEVIDELDWWGDTLKAVTGGGGVHLYYAWGREADDPVPSRNRVLGNVDIKGDGGYVVCPPAEGRRWLNWTGRAGVPEVPGEALRDWLLSAKGHGGSTGGAGAPARRYEPGEKVPAGHRYEHLRGLVYKLRKRGVSRADALVVCEAWWQRYEQPPVAEYELPWRQVEYEVERAWARVTPEAGPSAGVLAWADRTAAGATGAGKE